MRHDDYMKKRMEEESMASMQGNTYAAWAASRSTLNADMVNSPPHYNQAGVECIEAIRAATDEGYEYYLQGNIIKYLWRYRYKNGVQDLEKARWYLDKLIGEIEDE
tara:strand:- start:248 stop:565 length:318 start_codon:yes stop_codon:yes gene_type:complete